MTYSKGPWIYDAESGEIHTKDRTGFWGPDHEPVVVATVEPLDGVNNGPLLAAATELLDEARAFTAIVVTHECPSCGIEWSENECRQMLDEKSASCFCGYRHNFYGAAIAKVTGESK